MHGAPRPVPIRRYSSNPIDPVTWRTMRILVDRLTCLGFAMHQADTPYPISPNAGQLQDQTERLRDYNELQLPYQCTRSRLRQGTD